MNAPTLPPALREAFQLAARAGLFIAECPAATTGGTDYVVYRNTPGGRQRLGKRSSPTDLLRLVKRNAAITTH